MVFFILLPPGSKCYKQDCSSFHRLAPPKMDEKAHNLYKVNFVCVNQHASHAGHTYIRAQAIQRWRNQPFTMWIFALMLVAQYSMVNMTIQSVWVRMPTINTCITSYALESHLVDIDTKDTCTKVLQAFLPAKRFKWSLVNLKSYPLSRDASSRATKIWPLASQVHLLRGIPRSLPLMCSEQHWWRSANTAGVLSHKHLVTAKIMASTQCVAWRNNNSILQISH